MEHILGIPRFFSCFCVWLRSLGFPPGADPGLRISLLRKSDSSRLLFKDQNQPKNTFLDPLVYINNTIDANYLKRATGEAKSNTVINNDFPQFFSGKLRHFKP